jgi:hypothetical protein
VGRMLTNSCSNSIPWSSVSGAIVGWETDGRFRCSDRLSMLEEHVHIVPGIGRGNQ